MAPSRKSRSVNKRFSYVNEVSSNKTGENANKSRQKKRKLSDMLGPQWSKQELERFYEAYRKHGKDWRKVATVVRNRSVEMIEALYTMNRAYLSLPEGTASVVGFIATLTDHYCVPVIPNVQKRMYSDDEQLFAKISSYGNTLKAIETIKTKLTITQMQEFQKTCFGHFFNMQKLEHQGQVIHHLGLSMVECDDDAVMEFNFGGTGARFTDRDFALVTGLNFIGDIEAKNIEIRDIKTNNIQTKYLNKSSSIRTDKLLKYFEDADYEEDKDAVKMALLYFLNCGLIGVARKTNIDINFVRLVEDLDKFNKYPWGAYLYKLTVQALNDLFDNSKVRNASGTCDIRGFPLAFQVWAYEAISKLGEDGFAKRVKACMPRMLGWRATDHPSYKDLKDKLFGKKNYEVLWTLIPNEEELKKEYMTPWKNGHRKRRWRAQPIVEQYPEEHVMDTAADQSVPAAAQSLPSSNDHNHTNMGMILERLDRVEQRLDTLQSLCLAIFEKISSQAPTHDPSTSRDPSPSTSTSRDPSPSTSTSREPPQPPPRDPISHIDHNEYKCRY